MLVLDMLVVMHQMRVDVRLAVVLMLVDMSGSVAVFVDHCPPVIG